jgi:putative flavoprotein involved in K+ transport
MRSTETLIVGGGQAGLAMSGCLTDRSRDHVVLERGRVGERWRSERWDALRLLTPNWMSRLPGYSYRGPEPDGFMAKDDVVDYLTAYARSFEAPVEDGTTVLSVAANASGWRVETDRGDWRARNLVVATGNCDLPRVPELAADLAPSIQQATTRTYRNPGSLPEGGVLVVGASATGAQLADELSRAGRDVVLAVGRHNRLPRRYRGRDIMWWLDRMGILDRSIDDLREPEEARREPSLQLIGEADGRSLDLGALAGRDVRLAGRLVAASGSTVRFDRELAERVAAADEKLHALLERIDRYAATHGLDDRLPGPSRPAPVVLPEPGPEELDLAAAGIRSVLWATGFRRVYPWLPPSVLDEHGEIRQRHGRGAHPGLYALGLQFMTRRRSSFIDGVGRDAEELAELIERRRAALAA